MQLIADTAEKLAAGEILQIEKSLTRSMTEEVYYDMIYQKTASLISTCCELGAITSTGKDKDRLAMINYGTKLGMAFQVKDDLFDILGNEVYRNEINSTDKLNDRISLEDLAGGLYILNINHGESTINQNINVIK